jgi:6,7-dimethyl-8-ribityllumazine synthase
MPYEVTTENSIATKPNEASIIAIVVSKYNHPITDKLCQAAVETLLANEVPDQDIRIVRVPGAWELTYGTQQVLRNKKARGVIALGAVIKGETSHDQHINRAVSMGLMQLSLKHKKPVAFGLLTVNTLEQAIQRSGGNVGNKGVESALAMIDCLRLANELQSRRYHDA